MAVPGPAVAGSPLKQFGGTSAPVPCPASVAVGDIIAVFLEKELAAAVTGLPTDFAELGTAAQTTGNLFAHHVFAKRATAADTGTYSFSWTGSAPYIEALAVRIPAGLASGTFHEGITGAARSSAGTATPNVSLTTGGADRLVLWSGCNYNGGNWTPPSVGGTWTEVYDGGTTLTVASLSVAAGSTALTNVNGTCAASDYETARMLAILPAAAAVSSPGDVRRQRLRPLLVR